MKTIIPAALLAIVGLALALMFRLGAFRPVVLDAGEAGPFRLVYKKHDGPYYKIVSVIQSVELWAKQHGEKCALSFGEYIDDPKTADEDRLRSNGGCVFLKEPQPLPEGFETKTIPRRLWLTATFRGAPSIGPYKVYPRASEWMSENGYGQDGAPIEMYRVLSEKDVETLYYFPIKRLAPPEPAAEPDEAPPAESSTTSPRTGA